MKCIKRIIRREARPEVRLGSMVVACGHFSPSSVNAFQLWNAQSYGRPGVPEAVNSITEHKTQLAHHHL